MHAGKNGTRKRGDASEEGMQSFTEMTVPS